MKTAKGLGEFYRIGSVSEPEFQAWRDLHCTTNGLATDVINGVISLSSAKPQIDTVNGLAGTLSTERRRQIVAELKRDGLYIFPDRVDLDLVDQLSAFAFSHPSEPFPAPKEGPSEAIFDPDNPIGPTCWHKKEHLLPFPTV